MRAFTFLVATACLVASATAEVDADHKGTVSHYSTFVNETDLGTDVGITLIRKDGSDMASMIIKPGENATKIAIDNVGEDPDTKHYQTVAILLQESRGERCDACRTTMENLAVTIMGLVKEETQMAIEKAKQSGKAVADIHGEEDINMQIPPEKTRNAIAAMCQSENYMKYSTVQIKGCIEFLSSNGTAVANIVKDALQLAASQPAAGLGWGNTMNDCCSKAIPVCKPRPPVVKKGAKKVKVSKCRSCLETTAMLDFQLRRADPFLLERINQDASDAMSLNKKKKKADRSYMSPPFVRHFLSELCSSDGAFTLLTDTHSANQILEVCEDMVSDHEDDIVSLFSYKAPLKDVSREVCVEAAEACTTKEFDAVNAGSLLLSNSVVPFGPLLMSINPRLSNPDEVADSPREKAMRIAKADLAKATQGGSSAQRPVAPLQPSTTTTEGSAEADVEAAQSFLDKMDDKGKLTSAQLKILLKMVYKKDASFMRTYRLNRNKPDSKLLSRLFLLLPESTAAPSTPQKSEKKASPSENSKMTVPTDDEL